MTKQKKLKPDFLIIGAMKAGTTSLYRDIFGHPEIYLPEEKEPETLVRFGDNFDEIAKDYESLFKHAKKNQIVGEASTAYTKMPTYKGVASKASQLCGDNLKLIYIVRNPIERIISQYKHEHAQKSEMLDIDTAVFSDPKYIEYSDYSYQLTQWREYFSDHNILIIKFEEYILNKHNVYQDICKHLEIEYDPSYFPTSEKIYNSSKSKPIATKTIKKTVIDNKFYQRRLKKWIPQFIRKKIAVMILPNTKAKYDSIKLNDVSREKLVAEFNEKNHLGYNLNK